MNNCLLRIRGAVGICLTWAAGWAITGVFIGVASILLPELPWDSFFKVFDAPLPALAMPGFICGTIFSVVIGLAEHRRRFDDLSLARFSALGAVAGLLLSLVPAAMVSVGLAGFNRPDFGLWQMTAVISGPLIFLSAVSAAGSLTLARMAQPWRSLLVQLLEEPKGANSKVLQ